MDRRCHALFLALAVAGARADDRAVAPPACELVERTIRVDGDPRDRDVGRAALEADFRDPPADRRILQIIHGFPESPEARKELLDRLERRAFGGIVTNVAFRDYMRSEARWDDLRAGVEDARARGMTVWLYDEDGYPSGAAGTLVLEGHPEWEAHGLLCVSAATDGSGPLELTLPDGELLHLAAYPVSPRAGLPAALAPGELSKGVDLRERVGPDRKVRFEASGAWRVHGFVRARLYESTHADTNVYEHRPYPNIIEPDAMERFLALTHDEYARRFPRLEETFEAIFTDEPSLMSVFLREGPWPPLPWSSRLPARFREATGRELLPLLPALAEDFGPDGKRARCAFWSVVAREVEESYFGRIQAWCRRAGIASTGHLLAEEDLGSHVAFYGDFLACASRLDYPGIDCLTSTPSSVPWHIAKLLGSIACVHGRPKAMSETSDFSERYRPAGDTRPPVPVGPDEILGTTQILYVAGINTTTSYWSWAGLDDAAVRDINLRVGRLGALLAGGRHVCDVAVLYPVESAWAAFVPQRLWASGPGVVRVDRAYREAMDVLFRSRRDFDIVGSGDVARARAEGGSLGIGPEAFRIVVLPACEVLPVETLRRIAEHVRSGGAAIALGCLPESSPDAFPSGEVGELAAAIFGAAPARSAAAGGSSDPDSGRWRTRRHPGGGAGIFLPDGYAWLLPRFLDALLDADFGAPAGSPLRYTHRRKAGTDLYLVINDSAAPVSEPVSIRADGPASSWDPATGRISPLEPAAGGTWPVSLGPRGAAFLSFATARAPARLRDLPEPEVSLRAATIEESAGARPSVQVLPPAHVDARLSGASIPATVTATIRKGGVDSWCFLHLAFPEPLDVSAWEALEVELDVPAGQEGCGARFFAILREGEVDWIADVRQVLAAPGRRACAIPIDAFQLAGWSRDPDGRLDRRRIGSMRLGWGGYIGRTDETLTFRVESVRLLATH